MPESDHVYRMVELVGSSSESIEDAIGNAIRQAVSDGQQAEWFEAKEVRGYIEDGAVAWYQVKVSIGGRA